MCLRNGYQEIKTPLMYNKMLWERSGHWGKYRENMFLVLDPESKEENVDERASFSLKPMNCPSHYLFYQMRKHSYRELPIRYHTQDVLHRNEATGVLSGLTRVRQFQQDDAHIFLMESQIAAEVKRLTELIKKVYESLGLGFRAKFGTRPPQRIGADETWDRAEAGLRAAVEQTGVDWWRTRRRRVLRTQARLRGEGQHRPRMAAGDHPARLQRARAVRARIRGRRQQGAPAGGDPPRHLRQLRAVRRNPDRAFRRQLPGLAGADPGPHHHRGGPAHGLAREVFSQLQQRGLRVELDESSEKLGAKIRDAQLMKIPYTLVIGTRRWKEGRLSAQAWRGQGRRPRLPRSRRVRFEAVGGSSSAVLARGRLPGNGQCRRRSRCEPTHRAHLVSPSSPARAWRSPPARCA